MASSMGSHESPVMQSEVWLTPPHILAALGTFDLDPCACSRPRPWATAKAHYTKEDDGLNQPWFGRVWCNPPYGGPTKIGPWMRKMAAHGNGIALIFARTETAVFHDTVWNAASSVLFLKGRLCFCRADGVAAAGNAGAPSCLVAYGDHNTQVLSECGITGRFVGLRTHCI